MRLENRLYSPAYSKGCSFCVPGLGSVQAYGVSCPCVQSANALEDTYMVASGQSVVWFPEHITEALITEAKKRETMNWKKCVVQKL